MHLLAAVLALVPLAAAPRTFRVDYYHSGNATTELFSLDRLVLEPLPWPGHPEASIDSTNLGKYLFEVRDRATNRLLYSRGFASIYGEWELTAEARDANRTFHESLRFPAPKAPVQVLLKKRDARNAFREVWSLLVDPAGPFVDDAPPPSAGATLALQKSGDPARKLDLLILGDGYTAAERGKFEKDARRLSEVLFAYEPFKRRRADFNVWGLCPAAQASGISRPSTGVHRRSPIGATYDAFGSERYILSFENRALRDVAGQAPYELLVVLANNATYGGGGIFNLYATVAADSRWAPYIFVHELGHHLAGLGDEYFTSESVYEPAADRLEPWEKNVTALLDPGHPKWRASPDVPVPTPWQKEAFETQGKEWQKRRKQIRAERRPEAELDALFVAQREAESRLLGAERHAGKVGAFEGAMYEARGYFRPQADCVMFSRNEVPFCGVCREAIEEVISLYAR